MKFITVRDFRSRSAQVWKTLKEVNEMVITSNGKPVALLSSVVDENLETTLNTIRKVRAMGAVTAMQLQSIQAGRDKMTLAEINKEIADTRKGRMR